MKKIIITLAIFTIILFGQMNLAAQVTSPGDPGNDPEVGGDPPLGGGAPIGGGTLILIGLGVAYGGKKIYDTYKEENEE